MKSKDRAMFMVNFVGETAPDFFTWEKQFFDVECTMEDAINSIRYGVDLVVWSIVRLSDGVMISQSKHSEWGQ